MKNYSKLCPACNDQEIYYTTKKGVKYAINHNTICKKCRFLKKENQKYKRNCPKCDKELFTKNKFWNEKATKENKVCGSCSLKGRIFTDEWKLNLKKNHANFSGENNPFYKKHHSDLVKEKLSHISEERKIYLRKKFHEFLIFKKSSPAFNKRACKYLDKLNKERKWNLQHALNGGECVINGFWVDGYDKDKNIVVEYDEKKHYKANGNLRQKDIKRQNEIIKTLQCKFYRYNEMLDELYEVILLNEKNNRN